MKPDDLVEVAHDIVDDKGIIAEISRECGDAGKYRLHVFTVILVWGGFPIACVFFVIDLDNSVRGNLLYSTRNTERHGKFEVDGFGVNMHSGDVFLLLIYLHIALLAFNCLLSASINTA